MTSPKRSNMTERSSSGLSATKGVDVELRVGVDGKTSIKLQFDQKSIVPPDRHFSADQAGCICKNGAVKLLFGQENIVDSSLHALLIINFPQRSVKQFIQSVQSPSTFMAGIEADLHKEVQSFKVVKLPPQPSQVANLSASVALCAHSGQVANIDLYSVAPAAAAVVARQGQLVVDPVVRIELESAILYRLLRDLIELDEQGYGGYVFHEDL